MVFLCSTNNFKIYTMTKNLVSVEVQSIIRFLQEKLHINGHSVRTMCSIWEQCNERGMSKVVVFYVSTNNY